MPKDIPSAVITEMDATQKRPVLLFEIGLSSTLRFAAYQTNVTFPVAGNVYTAKTITIGGVKQKLEGQIDRITVKFDNVVKDMAGYASDETFRGVSLVIKRVYMDALGSSLNYNEVFNGYIEKISGVDRHWLTIEATTGKPLNHKTLKFAYQRMCPWVFGGTECNTDGLANLGSLSASGTADSGSTTILVDSALSESADYWNHGEIELTISGAKYFRKVKDFGSSTITFDVELPVPVTGSTTYTVYKGCDQVWETCEGTPAYGPSGDNSANFGGCIHIAEDIDTKPQMGAFSTIFRSALNLYQSENTMAEGVFVARCYGKCKIGGNKLRFNDPLDTDLRVIVGHCLGEVEGIDTNKVYINDVLWADLTGTQLRDEYTGTRTQTADARFSSRASAYRSVAYSAFTFEKDNSQIGNDPSVTVVMDGLKCTPIGGGSVVYSRNPAVVLYDFYINVEGYTTGDLDTNAFESLEELCDEVPTGGTLPRYRFDFNFDDNKTINDAKKLIWESFNGRVVMSQGKLKPVWDSAQMEDGAGGLTAKTVSHAFTEDNIVKDSISWKQPERPNLVRVHYKDSGSDYKDSSVEEKGQNDIAVIGEVLKKMDCYYITDPEIARRRAKYLFNKYKYEDYEVKLSALSGAGDLEVYDLVTVTHSLPGWTAKQFYVQEKNEDQYGRLKFTLKSYYSGVYDDAEVGDQAGYGSVLPNPYDPSTDSTSITATLVTTGTSMNYDAVKVSFTPPADYPFYAYSEIHASNDDSTYYLVGTSSGEDFVFNGMGAVYQPGDTVYIKLVNVNEMGIPGAMPVAYDASVAITGYIRFGSYYVGPYDIWGGQSDIDNASTKIVIGNLDGVAKIALGPQANAITYAGTEGGFFVDGDGYMRVGSSTHGLRFHPPSGVLDVPSKVKVGSGTPYLDIDGANTRIRSSNYVSGIAGAGFNLDPDWLEVGNIAARGIMRMAVFQADIVSVLGGNSLVRPGDVLAVDMTAADASTLTVEGNETFAVDDILRIKDGVNDEWLLVTNIASAPTYTVTRDQAGVYGADANPSWQAGAAVANYGQSGDGGVYMTASESNAPYLSVFTHAGAPWSAITTRLRVGNLNGFLGYTSDLYGIAIGETDAYLTYDPTNGMRIKGIIAVESMYGLPADENLVDYWSFDDGSGTIAVDGSGNDEDMTLYNTPSWVGGVSGQCIELNGSTQYAGRACIFSSNQTALSISCWVYVDTFNLGSGGAHIRTPFVSDWNTWDVGFQKGFSFSAYNNDTTSQTQFKFSICDGTNFVDADSTFIAEATFESTYADKWLHLVATFEASTAMKIYLDGEEIASNTSSIPAQMTPETATQTWVGRCGVNAGYLDGKIDEVRVYTAVLTESEIKALYLYPSGNKSQQISGAQTPWAHASDVTYIDGGNIYVGSSIGIGSATWQADGIQLQYNAGNPRFYCGDGSNEYFQFDGTGLKFSTAQSAGVNILGGADITLTGSDTDPGKVIFEGTSYTVEIGGDADGDRFSIVPGTTNVVDCYIGGPPFWQTNKQFESIYLIAYSLVESRAYYDLNNNASVKSVASSTDQQVILTTERGGTTRYVALTNTASVLAFHPGTDGEITLGRDTLCWADIYADAGVTSCTADRKYKADIEQETLGLNFINAVVPVEFTFKKPGHEPKLGKYRGIVAEEIQAALDEVGYTKDFAGIVKYQNEAGEVGYGFKYDQLIPPLIKAIQELSAEVELLKAA